jgi:hypothetical protein
MANVEDDIKEELERGVREENVYSEAAREELMDGDEISVEEEGFMKGYDEDLNDDMDSEDEEDED